ncbi:hypothetical protein U1Q18_038692, partial [Sarracenia purpurea var. burkii]
GVWLGVVVSLRFFWFLFLERLAMGELLPPCGISDLFVESATVRGMTGWLVGLVWFHYSHVVRLCLCVDSRLSGGGLSWGGGCWRCGGLGLLVWCVWAGGGGVGCYMGLFAFGVGHVFVLCIRGL